MSYQYNKPVASDPLNQSQGDLQGNFIALNTAFDVNHVGFNVTNEGKHDFIHFPNQTVSASFPLVTSTTEVGLYALDGNLFFRPVNQTIGTVTNDINLTGSLKTSTGWCMLPGGIIMKWGSGSFSASNSGTYSIAPIAHGTGIPTITTVLSPVVTNGAHAGVGNELTVDYVGFNDSAAPVIVGSNSIPAYNMMVYGQKPFSGSDIADFYYLILGI